MRRLLKEARPRVSLMCIPAIDSMTFRTRRIRVTATPLSCGCSTAGKPQHFVGEERIHRASFPSLSSDAEAVEPTVKG